jgi:hypothetical protein
MVIEMASFGVYKVWDADLLECTGCGHQFVGGFGVEPIRQDHYAHDFPEWLEKVKTTFLENGGQIVYDYEHPQKGVQDG